jgi:hypothetical protein
VKIYQKLVQYFYIPKLKKLEKEIGCRLVFNYIPERYIKSVMSCEMTKTWKKSGLNIEKGKNHFTVGKVVGSKSTRFDRNSDQYQSWLGGYTVKLSLGAKWTFEKHFELAIADQNSWLGWYNDPQPTTITEGWKPEKIGKIRAGKFVGTLYEFGCTTHSDVGSGKLSLKLYFASKSMATLFNLYNPRLNLDSAAFIPGISRAPFEPIDLKGYFAIFDVKKGVKTVLYGNGVVIGDSNSKKDTFSKIKKDLLKTIRSCKIMEL